MDRLGAVSTKEGKDLCMVSTEQTGGDPARAPGGRLRSGFRTALAQVESLPEIPIPLTYPTS